MSLRLRLIVAFFLFSVVPLAAVTFYSYTSNLRALQVAAQHETEMVTGELTQRMQVVTAQISERVEHLMDMPVATGAGTATGTTGQASPASTRTAARVHANASAAHTAAPPAPAAPATTPVTITIPAVPDTKAIEAQVAASLGDVAMLLNNVEVRGIGGGRRGGPGFPGGTLPSRTAPAATPNASVGAPASRRPFPPTDRSMAY